MAPLERIAAAVAAVCLSLCRGATAGIVDRTWLAQEWRHHEALWTHITNASEGMATDCTYLGDMVLSDPTMFPSACQSRAMALGGDTFDAKTDGSKCYFKKCGTFADIRFTTNYGARDTHTVLVGGWHRITLASDGVGTDCTYLGSLDLSDPASFPGACQSRAMVLGGDTFDVKPDHSKCYFKKCGTAADIRFTSSFGARDSYTVLVPPFAQVTQASDGVTSSCTSLGADYAVAGPTDFPMACFSKAAILGADTFDARPDGSACSFKMCEQLGEMQFAAAASDPRETFTTLGARWSQITRAQDGQATDCLYLGSYEPPSIAAYPQACYSKALVLGGDTFDAKPDGSKCYFKRCGSIADMRFTTNYGARDTHTILSGGWSQITLVTEGLSTDCPYLGSFEPASTANFPDACFSQAAILGGDTFDAKPDGSKCYFKRCGAFADIKFTTNYGARDSFTSLFPRGGDDWGPCDPAVCLDLHLLYTSKVEGRFLPVGGSGQTCDPDASGSCFGGTARRIAYVERQRQELTPRNESLVFFDMGGSTFGGPVFKLPEYPHGRPGTVLQNLIPYDFCLLSTRDFMVIDSPQARVDLVESFGNRTCDFLVSNARLNGLWEGFNAKTAKWVVKRMLNGWKVAFIGMLPYVASVGSNYGSGIITIDPDSVLAQARAGGYSLQVSAAHLDAELRANDEDFFGLPPHLQDVVALGSMVPAGVLAAQAEVKAQHPDVKAMVLLVGDNNREDQVKWMAQFGDFDVILREFGVDEPIQIPSKVLPNKQVLIASSETKFGVGHLKVRMNHGAGVVRFDFKPDVALDATIATNQTVEAIMSELYRGVRERNAQPFGRLTNPLVGGHRGDESPPSMGMCYYMECSPGNVIGRAHLWKALSSGHRADVSLYNLGGLRNSLRGDANGTLAIGHCTETLKFQNTLKLYTILGKDLYWAIKNLMVVEERGFIGAGVRVAFHEPCYDYVNHTNFFLAEGPPGSPAEHARCLSEGGVGSTGIKIIDMEVAHVDWTNCSDYTRCPVQWKTLQKGTSYTIVSTDYMKSSFPGFQPLEISLGSDAQALCEYVSAHSPLQVESWETYLHRGSRQYATASEGWAAGLRVASVRTAVSTIESAPTCPDGMYLPMRALACEPCPKGSQSIEEFTRGSCRLCAQGFFADRPQTDVCSPCPAGSFAGSPGSSACEACGAGTVSDTGAIYCNSCPPGQHAPGVGNRECGACPVATFAAGHGSASCEPCGRGLVTVYPAAVSADQCLCREGTYRMLEPSSGSGAPNVGSNASYNASMNVPGPACAECPRGMFCAVGSDLRFLGHGVQGPAPQLLPRHWASPEAPLDVFKCRSQLKCPGGPPGSACGPRLRSRACEYCEDGWYWTGAECRQCILSPFIFPIVPAALVPALVAVMYFTSRDTLDKWNSWSNAVACQVFIILNFYQSISLLSGLSASGSDAVLPGTMTEFFDFWTGLTDMTSIFRANCIGLDNFTMRTIVNSLVPLAVVMLGFSTMLFSILFARGLGRPRWRMHFIGTHHVIGSLLFTFFGGIAARALALFKCTRNPNGKQTLAEDASIICYDSADWQSMLVVGILCVLVYCIGVGAAFCRAVVIAPRFGNFGDPDFQQRWKFLFIKFRSEVYWFSIVVLLKNFLLNLAFVTFTTSISQIYAVMLVITIYGAATLAYRPFRFRTAYTVDSASSICIIYCCTFSVRFVGSGGVRLTSMLTLVAAFVPLTLAILGESRGIFNAIRCRKTEPAHREDEFSLIRDSCSELALMDLKEGAGLLCSVSEWDRICMGEFSKIVRAELVGEGGHRLASNVVSRQTREHAVQSINAIRCVRESLLQARKSDRSSHTSNASSGRRHVIKTQVTFDWIEDEGDGEGDNRSEGPDEDNEDAAPADEDNRWHFRPAGSASPARSATGIRAGSLAIKDKAGTAPAKAGEESLPQLRSTWQKRVRTSEQEPTEGRPSPLT